MGVNSPETLISQFLGSGRATAGAASRRRSDLAVQPDIFAVHIKRAFRLARPSRPNPQKSDLAKNSEKRFISEQCRVELVALDERPANCQLIATAKGGRDDGRWLLRTFVYKSRCHVGGLKGVDLSQRKSHFDRCLMDMMSLMVSLANPRSIRKDMKLSILTLVSAAVVGQGVSAHAEATFGDTLMNRLADRAAYEAKTSEIGPAVLLSELEESQEASEAGTSGVVPVNHCGDPYCNNYGGSWWDRPIAPGTGAFGGDSMFAASLGFNQDIFFGNYTTLFAGVAINELVDFTFYSILWHTDLFASRVAGGAAPTPGIGLWTEFGAGLNFKAMDGSLNINPQIGVLSGSLLSSGMTDTARVFDGVVPNLTINYDDLFLEYEFYMGYYVATRGQRENNSDFLHWWTNAGVKPWGDSNDWKSVISTGLHYENLRLTGPGDAANLYAWLGPYVGFTLPNGLGARFTAGWDVDRKVYGENFYKVNLTYDF